MHHHSLREAWFIRHAESVANAGGRTREAPSYSLSELGFRQARQLASALPAEPDLVVVSPYVRAQQTAEFTLHRFPRARIEEWPVQEVQYLDPALCVDTTQDERNALADAYWERCEPLHAAPNAESFTGFIARAADALHRLRHSEEKMTFIFCHGRVIHALAWLCLANPAKIDAVAMREFMHFSLGFRVPNCSVLPVQFHPDRRRSMGTIWIPEGVESEMATKLQGAREGISPALNGSARGLGDRSDHPVGKRTFQPGNRQLDG